MTLDARQTDRAVGALVASACGDALGAGHEFGPPLADSAVVTMTGGGGFGWAPGEWTDDTSMAILIARALARGERLDSEATLDGIVAAWAEWALGAPDVGTQTRAVFGALNAPTAAAAREAARIVHEHTGRSGGNGSLMRTAPVALAYLGAGEETALASAARAVSDLTHFEADAGDACALWCLAIRHAVLTGECDARVGLDLLPAERRARWSGLIDEAEAKQPRDFAHNYWVVEALQGAWSAIHHSTGLVDALERAVRGGNDTDTVAAIAGSLIGAATGVSGIPARWRRIVHGWPGLRARDLVELAVLSVGGGNSSWPTADRYPPSGVDTLVRHPHDDGVWMGSLAALQRLPIEVDAVVSLCRVGRRDTELETLEFWLVDQPGANADVRFVLEDAADAIAALRAEGRTVFVHCFEGRSRTPAAATAYSIRHRGIPADRALDEVLAALPGNHLNPEFRAVVSRDIHPAQP